jgi:hypothetical protein
MVVQQEAVEKNRMSRLAGF